MRIRALTIVCVVLVALGLVGVTLALAQSPAPTPAMRSESGRGTAAQETKPGKLIELLTGAGWITEPEVILPAISLKKTVGLDPNVCATTTAISVSAGTEVTYCYHVTNTGTLSLTRHTLDDSELGSIINDLPYALVPGASAFLTSTASIAKTTVNTGLWTAYNPGPTEVVTATAVATVTVPIPAITLEKTVGLDPNVCATTDTITAGAGTNVTYCYKVINTGGVTLTHHNVDDSELGSILNHFNYTLVPGASAFITETTTVMETTTNTGTWTSYNLGPTDLVTATDVATVTVPIPAIALEKTAGLDPGECGTTNALIVNPGTAVTFCYRITNTGDITLTRHSLTDSELGVLLNDFPFVLAPAATSLVRITSTIMETTVNTATWTAFNPGPTDVVTATAAATVTVMSNIPEINVTPTSLSAQLPPNSTTKTGLTIANAGMADLEWSVSVAPYDCGSPGVLLWAAADVAEGTTPPGGTNEVVVTFSSTGSPLGDYEGLLCVTSNDPDEPVVAVPLNLSIVEAVRNLLPVIVRP